MPLQTGSIPENSRILVWFLGFSVASTNKSPKARERYTRIEKEESFVKKEEAGS
jgi:hypothetical protein